MEYGIPSLGAVGQSSGRLSYFQQSKGAPNYWLHLCFSFLSHFSSAHLLSSLPFTIYFFLILFAVSFSIPRNGDGNSPQVVLTLVSFFVGTCLVYPIYTFEVFRSATFKYLKNLRMVEDVVSFINRVKGNAPVITYGCKCYHMETRTRRVAVHSTDTNGNRQTTYRTETYQEMVITHTESHVFKYSRFQDDSPALTNNLTNYNAVKLDFTKKVFFWK